MQTEHSDFLTRGLALLANEAVHFLGRLGDDFLNARRMNAAVFDQFHQRLSRDLAADFVERGNDDHTRCIVHDHVDSGSFLKRTDVAAFAADDTALHFIAGNVDGADREFGRVLRGTTLHGHADDLASLHVALIPQFGLVFEDQRAGLVLQFAIQPVEQLILRGLFVEAANFVELLLLVTQHAFELLVASLQNFQPLGNLGLVGLQQPFFLDDVVLLILERAFALVQLPFDVAQFVARLVDFPFQFFAALEDDFFGGNLFGSFEIVRIALGLSDNRVAILIGGSAPHSLEEEPDGTANRDGHQSNDRVIHGFAALYFICESTVSTDDFSH